MLRSARRSCPFWAVSPLEVTLSQFTESRLLTNENVSDYLVNQKPQIQNLNDFVFVHRLAGEYCFRDRLSADSDAAVAEYLRSTASGLSVESITTTGLSVLISCLADSTLSELNELLATSLREICHRNDQASWEPRVIARMCKGFAKLVSASESIDDESVAFLNARIPQVNWSESKIPQIMQVWELLAVESRCEAPARLVGHTRLLVPFMAKPDAARCQHLLKLVSGRTGDVASTIADLEDHLVRAGKRRAVKAQPEEEE